MARVFQSRLLTSGLKADISQLGQELTTGIRSDPLPKGSADFGPITRIERVLTTLEARRTVTAEANVVTDVMQTALGNVQENVRDGAQALLSLQGNAYDTVISVEASAARVRFEQVVSALNSNAAGRSMFAGAATDRPALANATDILTALQAAVASETTPAGVIQTVDAWFDTPGGGFEAMAYLGSNSPLGAFQISDDNTVRPDVKADDPALREAMKAFALTALAGEDIPSNAVGDRAALLQAAGEKLIAADQSLTVLRARLGQYQEQIEAAAAANDAMRTTLELSRNELIAVDPYETASRLEASYSQLETYYTLTARLSRLNFTDYLR